MNGPKIPAPTTLPPPEPITNPAVLAKQRRDAEAKRRGRASLVIDPAVQTPGNTNNETGLSLG